MDDNSVGEPITGSTGSPTNTGATYLYVNSVLGGSGPDVAAYKYLRFAYANSALQSYFTVNPCPIEDCQFVNCAEAVEVVNGTAGFPTVPIAFYNDLFSQCGNVLASQFDLVGEHITADQVGIYDTDDGWVYLTNCILTAVSDPYNSGRATISHCLQVGSSTGIFQTVGAGNYYLAASSTNRNAGSANVNSNLLIRLAQTTTYPPIVYSNVFISTNLTLDPQAQRDSDVPDLGYHYDPLDYIVDVLWLTNATLTVNAGTAVACYDTAGGLVIPDGSTINSFGTAASPNWFTRYYSVQEQPMTIPTGAALGGTLMVNSFHSMDTSPNGTFHFTRFACPAGGGQHLYTLGQFAYSNLLVQDCEFWCGSCDFDGNNWTTTTLKNNLFDRVVWSANASAYTNNILSCSNNLFWNLSLTVLAGANSNKWSWFNNQFYNASIFIGRGSGQPMVNGYNAYIINTEVTAYACKCW